MRKRRQPAEIGRLTIVIADESGGAGVFEIGGDDQDSAEAAVIRLTVGLWLDLLGRLAESSTHEAAGFALAMTTFIADLEARPDWDAYAVVAPYAEHPSNSITRPRKIIGGLLRWHPDDTFSTSWASDTPLGLTQFAELAGALAFAEAMKVLSEPARLWLLLTLRSIFPTANSYPEILDQPRRDFMAHALAMATLTRLTEGGD